jgi:hypothetical protein
MGERPTNPFTERLRNDPSLVEHLLAPEADDHSSGPKSVPRVRG